MLSAEIFTQTAKRKTELHKFLLCSVNVKKFQTLYSVPYLFAYFFYAFVKTK